MCYTEVTVRPEILLGGTRITSITVYFLGDNSLAVYLGVKIPKYTYPLIHLNTPRNGIFIFVEKLDELAT